MVKGQVNRLVVRAFSDVERLTWSAATLEPHANSQPHRRVLGRFTPAALRVRGESRRVVGQSPTVLLLLVTSLRSRAPTNEVCVVGYTKCCFALSSIGRLQLEQQ